MLYRLLLHSPLGPLTVAATAEALVRIDFGRTEPAAAADPEAYAATAPQAAALLRRAAIPYGETRTYAQIAAAVGNPRAVRAVGGANHRNPLPVVIPCHRVIGADGSLTGYAGGLERKTLLLGLERTRRAERE